MVNDDKHIDVFCSRLVSMEERKIIISIPISTFSFSDLYLDWLKEYNPECLRIYREDRYNLQMREEAAGSMSDFGKFVLKHPDYKDRMNDDEYNSGSVEDYIVKLKNLKFYDKLDYLESIDEESVGLAAANGDDSNLTFFKILKLIPFKIVDHGNGEKVERETVERFVQRGI